MILTEIDHVAIAVHDLESAIDYYRDAFGAPGEYADHLQVYGRQGELSPRSRTPIQRVKFGGSWKSTAPSLSPRRPAVFRK